MCFTLSLSANNIATPISNSNSRGSGLACSLRSSSLLRRRQESPRWWWRRSVGATPAEEAVV
ncbi:hypothetical protein Hanom_Chr16g01419071 [Helianthus anomalus]